LTGRLAKAEPLGTLGQIYELALAHEVQALAQCDHRGQRNDDRRQTQPGDEDAVEGAE
jgi:predicted metal-dependent phosphoesterase TrpH